MSTKLEGVAEYIEHYPWPPLSAANYTRSYRLLGPRSADADTSNVAYAIVQTDNGNVLTIARADVVAKTLTRFIASDTPFAGLVYNGTAMFWDADETGIIIIDARAGQATRLVYRVDVGTGEVTSLPSVTSVDGDAGWENFFAGARVDSTKAILYSRNSSRWKYYNYGTGTISWATDFNTLPMAGCPVIVGGRAYYQLGVGNLNVGTIVSQPISGIGRQRRRGECCTHQNVAVTTAAPGSPIPKFNFGYESGPIVSIGVDPDAQHIYFPTSDNKVLCSDGTNITTLVSGHRWTEQAVFIKAANRLVGCSNGGNLLVIS